MSNLCTEITLSTSPINHIDDGKTTKKKIRIEKSNLEKFNQLKKENGGLYNDINSKMKGSYEDIKSLYDIVNDEHTNDSQIDIVEDVEDVYGDKPAEIALCVLSAINCGEIKVLSDLEGVCENIVRSLDFVIEHQDSPVEAAKKMLKRRSIGVGLTNLAYYLAKNDARYDSKEALELVDELMEHIQ